MLMKILFMTSSIYVLWSSLWSPNFLFYSSSSSLPVRERKTSGCVFSCVFKNILFAFCITSLSMIIFLFYFLSMFYFSYFFIQKNIGFIPPVNCSIKPIIICRTYMHICKTELALVKKNDKDSKDHNYFHTQDDVFPAPPFWQFSLSKVWSHSKQTCWREVWGNQCQKEMWEYDGKYFQKHVDQ